MDNYRSSTCIGKWRTAHHLTKGKSCMFELTFLFPQGIQLLFPLEESWLWPWCTAQPDRSLTFDGTATRMLTFLHYMCTLRADSSFELYSNVYQALLNPEKAGDFTGEEEGCGGYWDSNLKHFDQKPSVFTTWPSHLLLMFYMGASLQGTYCQLS